MPDDLFDLYYKVAIVTGGGRGLGVPISNALAARGSNIIICSRKLKSCEEEADRIISMGVRCKAVKCDVTDPKDVQNLSKVALAEFGGVDILVNNAGATWGGAVLDYPLESWKKVIDVNVTGMFLCCQAIGKIMVNQGGGKIINISSIFGVLGGDPSYMDAIAYNTSKGANIAFTKDLAVKWGQYNINVNAVAPGFMLTDMTSSTIERHEDQMLRHIPFQRLGKAEDLKGTIIFLASRASEYVTGQVLFVDGGWHVM